MTKTDKAIAEGADNIHKHDLTWTYKDYEMLAHFMLYPDTRKRYAQHHGMLAILTLALIQLDTLRKASEPPLQFDNGNRTVTMGNWYNTDKRD